MQVERNSELFWQLVEKEHARARAYCSWLAGNSEDGDDLYQDSVIKAFGGFSELREVDSFKWWFYRIVSNTFRSRARNPWWKRVISGSTEIEDSVWSSDPANVYDARRRLDYALGALSTDDRIIVTLAELEGWKISELAEIIAKTEGFVKMRLSRAREKMRKRLASHYLKTTQHLRSKGSDKVCSVTKPEID